MRIYILLLLLLFNTNIYAINSKYKESRLLNKNAFTTIESQHFQNYVIVNSIEITGNKITKKHIISRELLFKENDTIRVKDLKTILYKSRENLLNTSLFNFVTIDSMINDTFSRVDIRITLVERWYTWPFPLFEISERNFNVWWETKDFSRVNYGLYLVRENFRGRKETVKLLMRFGYDEKFELTYQIPYINKKQTIGFGLSGGISRNHQVAYESYNNKQRFYKNENNYAKTKTFSKIEFVNRRGIHNTHTLDIEYNFYEFADTLLSLNEHYSYDNKSSVQYVTLYYLYKSDYRDIKAYPLKGHYFDVEVVKDGLGIVDKGNPELFYVKSSVRKYWKLNKRFYFASGMNAKISNRHQPYYLQSGIGYGNDNIRSYEYYVIEGQKFGLVKTNLKYELLSPKVYNFKFIPTEKFSKIHYAFYLNLFADAGYVDDKIFYQNNSLTNEFLYGMGIGIDFVTYYDKVLRIEYSINKLADGIFINFTAPI